MYMLTPEIKKYMYDESMFEKICIINYVACNIKAYTLLDDQYKSIINVQFEYQFALHIIIYLYLVRQSSYSIYCITFNMHVCFNGIKV